MIAAMLDVCGILFYVIACVFSMAGDACMRAVNCREGKRPFVRPMPPRG